MIFGRRANSDIHLTYPTSKFPPPWEIPCSTGRSSRLHFLNIPTEIRRLIFHEYFLSLNLPDQFFHHLTLLGYWGSSSEINTTSTDPRGYDLGRKIRHEIECILLVNRQIQIEADEVLYNSFIFYVHPRYQTDALRQSLYNGRRSHRGPRLPVKVKNIQINIAFGPPNRQWSTGGGWRESWLWLAANFPPLRRVGLAIEYDPRDGDDESSKQLMEMLLSFVRIFQPNCHVHVRFANVKYDRYAILLPVSPPLYADMLDEEKLLLELRDEKRLIWHNVAQHFNESRSELYSVAGLQARYQRLKLRQIQAEMEVDFLKRLKEELRIHSTEQRPLSLQSAAATEQ